MIDIERLREIIGLLRIFKEVGEQLCQEKGITITLIVPLFTKLKETLLKPVTGESSMIRDMKNNMLAKLETRYSADQIKNLNIVTFLDPRFRANADVTVDQVAAKVKKIVEENGCFNVGPTQSQEIENISRFPITSPSTSMNTSSTSSVSVNPPAPSPTLTFSDLFTDDYVEDNVADVIELDEKIKAELYIYNSYKLLSSQKKITYSFLVV